MTVPRLKLAAAAVGARLNAIIRKELEIRIDQITFWTDSTTVLRYLWNETARYQVYVANRLAMIRDESSRSQWRYVKSDEYPADGASRGVKATSLLNHRWLHGPDFLQKEEKEWPTLPEGMEALEPEDDEVLQSKAC